MPASSPIEILAQELGEVAGRIERDSKLRIDAALAEIARRDAERELRVLNLERRLDERMASLRDGEPGRSVTVDDVAPLIEAEVARQVAALPAPEPGRSVTTEDLRPMLQGMVDALPPAEDGKSVTIEDVRPILEEMVASLPLAEPGKSVTVDDVAPLISAEVARQIAALPPAEAGKSVTVDDVRPLLQEMVDALPKARDGEPGKSVTAEDVRPMLQEMVDALPAAERGLPGERGPEGRLVAVKAWEDRVHYDGAIVTHEGSTWQAQRDTGHAPPHADWVCLARAGSDGRDGLSIEVEGTYDAERKDYRRLSIVALNGGSFIARRDEPGPCPGEGWQLLASQGKRGQPGERGPAGRGERGDAGPAVAALHASEQGMVTLVNADGSTVEMDLYPLLSKLQG